MEKNGNALAIDTTVTETEGTTIDIGVTVTAEANRDAAEALMSMMNTPSKRARTVDCTPDQQRKQPPRVTPVRTPCHGKT